MDLRDYGWSQVWQTAFEAQAREHPGALPARVLRQDRHHYLLATPSGESDAQISGKYRHEALGPAEFPAVGDWVAAERLPGEARAVIHALLPRRGAFARRAPGAETLAQVAAANVDAALIVMGLDGDYNLRRLERYLTLVWDSGAAPVVILNKRDQCPDAEARVEEAGWSAAGAPVLALSALTGEDLALLAPRLLPGQTAVLLGSSGAGKSTLLNRLLGEERQRTAAVREDDSRGRHTTTHRELLRLPSGALVIDTPGMRELQLWAGEESLDRTFADIAALSEQCRFRDCGHDNEPGCAVQAAVESGALAPERLASYRKQLGELAYLARQQDRRLQLEEKQKWKTIHKAQKELQKRRTREGR